MPTDKQRRDAQRRRLQRQAQRRAERARNRRRLTLIASIVGAAVIVAVIVLFAVTTSNDTSTPAANSAPTPTAPKSGASTASSAGTSSASTTAAPGTCTYTKSGTAARTVTLPAAKQPHTGTVAVAVSTTRGAMTFTLDRAKAPCAVGSFVSLAKQKYFDKTPCHRLTTTGIFVLQCGDPTGTGSGGPGYKFADELTGKESYTRGVLAMANSGANTNGSQFFIVYKNTTSLGPQYTIFGHVTAGLSVVDGVAAKGAAGSTGDGKPKESISITKASVG